MATVHPASRQELDWTIPFCQKGTLVQNLKTWWYPPPNEFSIEARREQNAETYHLRRLYPWMPRKIWRVDFRCVHCSSSPPQSLRSKGVYKRVHHALDVKDLAGEYIDCGGCGGTFISWDQRMLEQLPDGVRAQFPVILTRKYAADRSVVSLLWARTLGNSPTALGNSPTALGNSPTALANNLLEAHSEEWLQRTLNYLHDCDVHRRCCQRFHLPLPLYKESPPFPMFPRAQWFLSIHIRDIWSRSPSLLAAATSVHGSILKIDSTKKITEGQQLILLRGAPMSEMREECQFSLPEKVDKICKGSQMDWWGDISLQHNQHQSYSTLTGTLLR